MNELRIPTLINSGKSSKFLKRSFLLLLLLALLLHLGAFAVLSYYHKHPFLFLFKQEENIIPEDTLNYVLVADNLLEEEIKEEKPRVLGKISRQSRDTQINPDLPKLGPSSEDNSQVDSFTRGKPIPDSAAAPEIMPTPPPLPTVTPQEAVPPVIAQLPTPEPIKKTITEQPPEEKTVPELPELDMKEDLSSILPAVTKQEKPQEEVKIAETRVPGITKTDSISKIQEKPVEKIKEKPQKIPKPVTQPRQQPVKEQKAIPTRKIPVRKIGNTSAKNGGKLHKRLNSSAINTGSKSIAVLRSRYGEYMDKILRRIQQAIIIQQQINPISLHEGNVVMSFTIDPAGYLSGIQLIGSKPQEIATEISAARSVLQDVHNSGPFEPPSQEMLNDPDFQKIIINFVFENL